LPERAADHLFAGYSATDLRRAITTRPIDRPHLYGQVSRVATGSNAPSSTFPPFFATHGQRGRPRGSGTDLCCNVFPDAVPMRPIGTADDASPGTVGRLTWELRLPRQIPPSPVNYRTSPVDGMNLRPSLLAVAVVIITDTDATTCCTCPHRLVGRRLRRLNGGHQYLLEKRTRLVSRLGWPAHDRSRRCSPVPSWQATEQGPARRSAILSETREYCDPPPAPRRKAQAPAVFRRDDHARCTRTYSMWAVLVQPPCRWVRPTQLLRRLLTNSPEKRRKKKALFFPLRLPVDLCRSRSGHDRARTRVHPRLWGAPRHCGRTTSSRWFLFLGWTRPPWWRS